MGIVPTLVTFEPTDWSRVEKLIGVVPERVREVHVSRGAVRFLGLYSKLGLVYRVWRLRRRFDAVVNTHGDVVLVPYADVIYMHYPHITYTGGELYRYFMRKYERSVLWKLYSVPYRVATHLIKERSVGGLIITNSRWSRGVIEEFTGKRAVVIHPPVPIEKFIELRRFSRERLVISITRFTWEKRPWVIPHIARLCPDIEFVLIGSLGGFRSRETFERVLRLRERFSVRNLKVLVDVPEGVKLSYLARARAYLHTMISEHFGIAPLEAMASGCVVIAHASGGLFTDVLDYGRYGLVYRRYSEVPELIYRAVDEYPKHVAPTEHVLKFTASTFRKKMRRIFEKVLST